MRIPGAHPAAAIASSWWQGLNERHATGLHYVSGIAFGVASVAVATCARLILDPALGDISPFQVFLLATLLTARCVGLLPALLSAALSVLSADYFFLAPRGNFGLQGPAQYVDLAVFLVTSMAVALVGGAMHRASQRDTRKLRETRNTLAHTEETLALMLKSTGVSLWSWNILTDSITGDENAAAQFGVAPENFPRTIAEFAAAVHPDDRARVQEEVTAALSHEAVYKNRFRTIWPNGSVRCLSALGIVYRDSEGQPVQFTGVCTDVTDHWQTEQNLRAAMQRLTVEARFRSLLEAAPDAVVVVDRKGAIVLINAQAEALFGYSREELLGQTVERLVPQRFQRMHAGQVNAYFHDPHKRFRHGGEDFYALRKDGTELPVEISLSPLETDEGPLVYSTIRDVTERKNAERSREQLASIVDYSSDAIVRKSMAGIILNWNNGAKHLYGYTAEEVVGKSVSILMVPGGEEELSRTMEKIARGEAVTHETVRRRKDGVVIDVAVSVSPIRNEAGEAVAASAIARDISERKKAEQEILGLNGRLEQVAAKAEAANLAKSTFLSTMSHEIRTPMNAILGYAQLMERDHGLGAEAKANLKIIGRSGEHLLALINDVLDMAKIEAGRVELRPVTFNLSRLLNDLGAMFRLRAEAKGLRFELVTSGERVPYVVADEGKTRQVLINLLGNAVKFTHIGQIALRAATEVRDGGQLWLSAAIADSGPGMTEEEQSRLFEPFCQPMRDLNTQQGTGLGLAISRKYARLMGGEIGVASASGRGSTFVFEIPIERGDSGFAKTRSATGRVIRVRPDREPARILVADDHPENRGWLVKLLDAVGFLVREANNGEMAVQVCEEWQPQLILMDIHMPVMDGLEATRQIKASPGGSQTVVIALTASAMESDRRSVERSGADDFLAKPCGEDELLEKIGARLHVDYDYAESVTEERATSALTAAGLRGFPAARVEQLREATLNGNRRTLNRLIGEIRGSDDTGSAQALQDLVDRYEYDTLTELLEGACQR